MQKKSNFENFESALYSTSVSMPLNCDIPHNSYPYIAWVDEASKIKYLTQGHKHVGANGPRTHNLPFMSPALFR